MVARFSSVVIALAALPVAWSLDPDTTCQAQVMGRYGTPPALFCNYYVPAGDCGGVPAQLYPSPRPTPPVVGHTYVTYQPLMPHEFLGRHRRKYWSYNSATGVRTRTVAVWRQSWFNFAFPEFPQKPIQPPRGTIFDPLLGTVRYR
ncbi:MAG: hypothetical protein ACYSWU_08080 [Planctomycetota bacterium]|jgi:hypothetical protein